MSILKREFNSFSVPMFAVGGYGLPPYFAMELSAFSSRDDWKIWIANAGSQRLSYGHRFDGKEAISLLQIKSFFEDIVGVTFSLPLYTFSVEHIRLFFSKPRSITVLIM